MTDPRCADGRAVRLASVRRFAAGVGALAVVFGTAACAAGDDLTPPATTATPVASSAMTTTVPVPVRNTDYFDPVDIATSFMINYASGSLAAACRFVSDDYSRTEAQAGGCSSINHVERLPVVTLVDSCELADETYRVRFTVVPGAAERPLPIVGSGELPLAVGVSLSERYTYGVDGPPTAYDPGSSCTDSDT